jgi:hypothetical protein
MLRRRSGPKREEVAGDWRRLHNEELHNLYISTNIIREMKLRMGWVGHVAWMGEVRNLYIILVGNPEGKRPFGRPRRRCEDYIRMYLKEIVRKGLSWIHEA